MSKAGRQEFELIELIDPDPTAFGGAPMASSAEHIVGMGVDGMGVDGMDVAAHASSTATRSQVPATTTVVLVMLVAAALVVNALLPLWGMQRPGRVLTFPPLQRQLPTLDGHLVFDQAPGELAQAELGTEGVDGRADFLGLGNRIGYVFADPEASLDIDDGYSGRVAIFWSTPWEGTVGVPADTDTGAGTDIRVQGAPAVVETVDTATIVSFGPVDGRDFVLETHNLDTPAALRLAEVIAIRDGVPTITDDRALDGMRPVGGLDDFFAVLLAVLTPTSTDFPARNLVFVHYTDASGTTTLSSIPAPRDTLLPMLRLVLPLGSELTVRGTSGWVVDANPLPDQQGDGTRTLIAWVEGGRLLVVLGPGDEAATLELAESIRPATDEEWADVAEAAEGGGRTSTLDPFESAIDAEVVLDNGATPDGEEYSLVATWNAAGRLDLCAETSIGRGCSFMTQVSFPLLAPLKWGDKTFLAAVIEAESTTGPAFLELTFTDPAVARLVYPLEDVGRVLPGPAVGLLLTDGVATAELRVDGVAVATLTFSPAG